MCVDNDGDVVWEKLVNAVQDQMVSDFIFRTSKEEGVGVQDREEALKIIACTSRSSQNQSLSQAEQETHNLMCACQQLEDVLFECRENDQASVGLIDVQCMVQCLNKKLLCNVDLQGKTKAGTFSTESRVTTYKGRVHEYPLFDTPKEVYDAVLLVVDRYNSLLHAIKDLASPVEKLTSLYKCAAWLLFELVSLHPFSDGNGRVSRLLCNYCLRTVTPFSTPLHSINGGKVQENYIDAIVAAHESKHRHPVDLTCLLVESSWKTWGDFMKQIQPS